MISLPSDVTDGTVEAAREIANERANALREIKARLLSGEDDQALSLMKKFFGLDEQNTKGIQAGT